VETQPFETSPSSRLSSTSGVIWISGFSGAGKTTVGREVEALLRQRGIDAIFLDGDDLRRIFAQRWGYERSDRVELAHVYFRLSSYLASQGYTVVIAAIAMYDEVREWLRENIAGVYEVYLDVPESERLRRDSETKRVYSAVKATNTAYDIPSAPDLRIANFDDISPDAAARTLVEGYLSSRGGGETGDKSLYWQQFYSQGFSERRPSSYALHTASALQPESRLLEIGCGNGRDALFFAGLGHEVVAIDPSRAAIESCRELESPELRFLVGRFPDVDADVPGDFDAVYSRFSLHAMTQAEQDDALAGACARLRPGGRLFVECRSINDPLARKGEVISPTERIHGHYRRFLILERLLEQLEGLGLRVDDAVERNGLARYKDDDPVVIRVTASLPA
jgi:bifunctional enzyme CysN/CysC